MEKSPCAWAVDQAGKILLDTAELAQRFLSNRPSAIEFAVLTQTVNQYVYNGERKTLYADNNAFSEKLGEDKIKGSFSLCDGLISVTGSTCARILRPPFCWAEALAIGRLATVIPDLSIERALNVAIRMKIEESITDLKCGCSAWDECKKSPAACFLTGLRPTAKYTEEDIVFRAERLFGAAILAICHSIVRKVARKELSPRDIESSEALLY
jgi:hypothetical protein